MVKIFTKLIEKMNNLENEPMRKLMEKMNILENEHMRKLIEKEAYARAEKRNFEPGHELEDWLAAEQHIHLVYRYWKADVPLL